MKSEKREIIGLALLLDEISDYVVFVDYSGHVKSLSVRVKEGDDVLFNNSFYVDFEFDYDHKNYLVIRSFLESKIAEVTEIK